MNSNDQPLGASVAPTREHLSAWLAHLSPREIAWLILRLHALGQAHSWIAPERAQARIALLRGELRARGEVLGNPAS